MAFDIDMIKKVYENMPSRVDSARAIVGRHLTLTEKILYSHLWEGNPSKAFKYLLNYILLKYKPRNLQLNKLNLNLKVEKNFNFWFECN